MSKAVLCLLNQFIRTDDFVRNWFRWLNEQGQFVPKISATFPVYGFPRWVLRGNGIENPR